MVKRPALFNGYWFDMAGKKLRRVSRLEHGELRRLWWKHKDVREKKK